MTTERQGREGRFPLIDQLLRLELEAQGIIFDLSNPTIAEAWDDNVALANDLFVAQKRANPQNDEALNEFLATSAAFAPFRERIAALEGDKDIKRDEARQIYGERLSQLGAVDPDTTSRAFMSRLASQFNQFWADFKDDRDFRGETRDFGEWLDPQLGLLATSQALTEDQVRGVLKEAWIELRGQEPTQEELDDLLADPSGEIDPLDIGEAFELLAPTLLEGLPPERKLQVRQELEAAFREASDIGEGILPLQFAQSRIGEVQRAVEAREIKQQAEKEQAAAQATIRRVAVEFPERVGRVARFLAPPPEPLSPEARAAVPKALAQFEQAAAGFPEEDAEDVETSLLAAAQATKLRGLAALADIPRLFAGGAKIVDEPVNVDRLLEEISRGQDPGFRAFIAERTPSLTAEFRAREQEGGRPNFGDFADFVGGEFQRLQASRQRSVRSVKARIRTIVL